MKNILVPVLRSIKKVVDIQPSRILFNIIFAVLKVINSFFISVILFQKILDSIFVQNNFTNTVCLVITNLLFIIIHTLFTTWYNRIYIPKSNTKIKKEIQVNISSKSTQYDISVFTDPKNSDRFRLVINNTSEKLIDMVDTAIMYLADTIILFLTGSFFIVIEPIIAVSIGICFILDYLLTLKINKISYERDVILNGLKRKNDYLIRTNYLKQYSEDYRTTHISAVLSREYRDNYYRLRKENKKYLAEIVKYTVASSLIKLIFGSQLPYIFLGLYAIVSCKYTAVDIAVIVAAMIKLRTVLTDIAIIFPKLRNNMRYINDYDTFMEYQPQICKNERGVLPKNAANSIVLRNISFSYDKEKPILKNISMHINSGEKIAIVGPNGSGKTTLTMLIMRLYLPDQGMILLDQVPAELYNLEAYRARFSVAFQKSNIYSLSLAENVLLDVFTMEKEEMVMQALEKVGMKKKAGEYPDGISSIMTREFDENGIVLSGGQNQKIALSRIYTKESGVLILDEPSSSLDSKSENEMYRAMLESAQGKTLILISHRLSSVKDVDRIYYMERGRIVESGCHEELMNLNGKYAQMWHAQADKYAVEQGGQSYGYC